MASKNSQIRKVGNPEEVKGGKYAVLCLSNGAVVIVQFCVSFRTP